MALCGTKFQPTVKESIKSDHTTVSYNLLRPLHHSQTVFFIMYVVQYYGLNLRLHVLASWLDSCVQINSFMSIPHIM